MNQTETVESAHAFVCCRCTKWFKAGERFVAPYGRDSYYWLCVGCNRVDRWKRAFAWTLDMRFVLPATFIVGYVLGKLL